MEKPKYSNDLYLFPELMIEDDLDLCTEVLEVIVSHTLSLPTKLKELTTKIMANEWEVCKSLVHSLIGSTGSVGYIQISLALREVESLIKVEDVAGSLRVCSDIGIEVSRGIKGVEVVQKLASSGIDGESVREELKKLL